MVVKHQNFKTSSYRL